MHTRIRTTAGGDPQFLASHLGPRFFKTLLDRDPVRLDLPTDEIRTIVSDRDF